METLRETARASSTAAGIDDVFVKRFGLTLADLGELYDNPNWRSHAYGGNAWAAITAAIEAAGAALDHSDPLAAEKVERVIGMNHNTGNVGEKLRILSAVGD